MWTELQRLRLAVEEDLIREKLTHFSFQDRASYGITTVRGTHTTARGRAYDVCLWFKKGYPYEMPALYITSPCPLYGFGAKNILSYKTSHEMHVWESDWNNYVKICHWKSEFWSASNTALAVLMKGLLWLEAFEAHCKTGHSIDYYSLAFS